MKIWIVFNLKSVFLDEVIIEDNFDYYFLQLCDYLLKMVIFFVCFFCQFGYVLKIYDFIRELWLVMLLVLDVGVR